MAERSTKHCASNGMNETAQWQEATTPLKRYRGRRFFHLAAVAGAFVVVVLVVIVFYYIVSTNGPQN